MTELVRGFHTVTPYLVVRGVDELLAFVEEGFGGRLILRQVGPEGTTRHAEILVGDSMVMAGEAGGGGPMPGMLFLYVADADAAYRRAVEAGATSLREPVDEGHGDRMGAVEDRWGNQWWLASPLPGVRAPEMVERERALQALEQEVRAARMQAWADNVAPIRRVLSLPVPAERAFALWVEELGTWWPREYTWAGDLLGLIAIEPRTGGRCYERGPHGFECDWGRVTAWLPPQRLAFTWQINPRRQPEPNPERASEVEVRFVANGPSSTRVEFEHRGLERHGDDADTYRAALDAPEGWTYILERYAAAAAGS